MRSADDMVRISAGDTLLFELTHEEYNDMTADDVVNQIEIHSNLRRDKT